MLPAAMFLAALAGAGEQHDCGFVAGGRYWITTRGIVFPDGHLLEDYRTCIIPEGVVLAVLWDEAPSTSIYIIETHASCTPVPNEAEEVAVLVSRARKALDAKGIAAADVPVHEGECAQRRRVDVKTGL